MERFGDLGVRLVPPAARRWAGGGVRFALPGDDLRTTPPAVTLMARPGWMKAVRNRDDAVRRLTAPACGPAPRPPGRWPDRGRRWRRGPETRRSPRRWPGRR
ncbi:hypothetical protein ACFQS1_12260 [Paractinoplanes rhizophilus]|uniref:Uncharacterized protein n=1 Tax=Paractinoplanes rhizophilus TaxID=1416877 RepID=A0ABW2HTC0_9ACTN|nr:hypothetical protein [Actinoplanes sp.]